jgi:hypothetical protein
MPLPQHTEALLYGAAARGIDVTWRLPGEDGQTCEGAAHHSPTPLFTKWTSLVLRSWWPEDATYPWWDMGPHADLCGTCRDNLNILLQMLHATEGHLDWEIRREFGNRLRALAERGWEWFAKQPKIQKESASAS